MNRILVTGAAGFIGFHVARRLLEEGARVTGIDNLNRYYSRRLKLARLDQLSAWPRFEFARLDIADRAAMEDLFSPARFDTVIHLAAQAGVRYSIENPHVYGDANLVGFLNVLEGARSGRVKHLIYASSSSVYGDSAVTPLSTGLRTDAPVSLYAATKKSNELMAHSYAHLFGMAATGLRFFTVYGPWGRPDMAPLRFLRAILRGKPIDIYGYGRMQRDFTYAGDAAEGVVRAAERGGQGHRIFNVGHGAPVSLMEFVGALEAALHRRARKRFLPLQPGDVVSTHADSRDFWQHVNYAPQTPLSDGIEKLTEWYLRFYQTKPRQSRRAPKAQSALLG